MGKQIRVLHVVRKMDIGGVQMMLMNYYRHINRNSVQFDFVVQGEGDGYFDNEIKSLGGNIYKISSIKKLPRYYIDLYKLIKFNNIDVVHVHHNYANFHGLLIALLAGVKVRISHSHNTPPETKLIKIFIKRILRLFINLMSTSRVACSKVAFEWLYGTKYKNDSINDYIINNAIDTSKFMFSEKIRCDTRKELGISDEILIGHIGSYSEQKNHKYIIKIFKEVQKLNEKSILVLVGEGPLKKEIEDEISKLELQDKTILLGTRNDVEKLFNAFDIFIFPSLYEGLGIVLVEAQTSGLFCIASSTITKEVALTDLISYKSIQESQSEWAREILSSVNKNNRVDHSTQVKNKGYDISVEAKRLERIYQNLVKSEAN